MTFKVKKGVVLPSPDRTGKGKPRKYPFDSLEVNEICFIPDTTTYKISSYVGRRGRELNKKFTTQMATMRQDLQTNEWELCKPGAVGSKRGVAVCRIL